MDDAGPKALLLNIDFLKDIPSEDFPALICLVLAMITCLIISAICAASENAFFSHKENDLEELEFDLIDLGGDEVFLDEETNQINIYGEFTAFGAIQKFLEEKGYELMGADFERIPDETKELTDAQVADVEKLIERLEEDDDVQNVYHNMG